MSQSHQILPTIHALWIGDTLGKISTACLSSFIKQGHPVHLHAYMPICDMPVGVTLCDGNLIIPKEKIIKHKATGSYALFSDIFRYELLKKVDGIYVDCDVFCLKPIILPEHGYLFGYEDDHKINGAILALPKDSQLLNTLIKISHDPNFIPPWYRNSVKKRLMFKKMLGFAKHISKMPWGAIGPEAISYYAKQHQVAHLAQNIDVFYPVHYDCIGHFLNPNLSIHDIITPNTVCIHLYNEKLRHIDLSHLNQNCILNHIINPQ